MLDKTGRSSLVLDARYGTIRHNGAIRSCTVLTEIGIDTGSTRRVRLCSRRPLIGDDWETERASITMEARSATSEICK